jgi:hypothetical protein
MSVVETAWRDGAGLPSSRRTISATAAAEPGSDGGVQGWVDSTATPTRYGLSLKFLLEVLIAATRPGWSPASRTWVAFGVLDATHRQTVVHHRDVTTALQPKAEHLVDLKRLGV